MCLKDIHLAPFLFSALLYWYPPLKETSVCSAAHALPKKTLKYITHPNARTQAHEHTHLPSLHLLSKSHPQHEGLRWLLPQPESGQHFCKGQAFLLVCDWLVLCKRSANGHCHWAVMDEVAGAGAQAQKPGQEAFHSAMVTITVTHSDTCLGAAFALGKENRKWYMGQLPPELILLICWPAFRVN